MVADITLAPEPEPAVPSEEPLTNQLTPEDVAKLAIRSASSSTLPSEVGTPDPTPAPVVEESSEPLSDADGMHYCPECFVPLHPDPKPETLYIFLHARRYTTSLGSFETEMPEWAAEDWEWER